MTSDQRFEQELPGLLNDLYLGPMPTYRDDILQATARTRQRPAWSFVERWLPILDAAHQPVMVRRIPWRSLGLAVLLAGITLALIAALIAGSRPRVPAPFGIARPGLVAYAKDGDIYTVDPTTGASTVAVAGPATDLGPRWSLDGTRLAFERKADGEIGPGMIFVARADGTDLIRITQEPIAGITSYAFSPDGNEVLISASPRGLPLLLIAMADGSQTRVLLIDRPAAQPAWRPPDGAEILFTDVGTTSEGYGGLYAVNAETGQIRTILEPASGRSRDLATWSPDGSRIAYMEWRDDVEGISSRIRIIAADGTGDRPLPMPPDAVWEVMRGWSNDGTRVLAIRGYTGGWVGSVAVARPVDGSGFGVEIDLREIEDRSCCSVWEWAPDDESILGMPTDAQGGFLDQVLLDPVTGSSTAVPWTTSSHPTWQRLAD